MAPGRSRGVGGGLGGAEASATALETALAYMQHSMACYYRADATEDDFINELQKAAVTAHGAILAKRAAQGVSGTMATTLTLFMGVWPWYYILQVGDSRYYLFRDGELTQLSRDQTIAQDLVDYVVPVDSIGDASKIVSGTTRVTEDPVGLAIASVHERRDGFRKLLGRPNRRDEIKTLRQRRKATMG